MLPREEEEKTRGGKEDEEGEAKMSEMINKLSQEVNNAVTESMSDVQDYVNITLQVMDPIPSPNLRQAF
jgi:hypothetical protein